LQISSSCVIASSTRSYHTSTPLYGRKTGASAHEVAPREFSKKQKKRFKKKVADKIQQDKHRENDPKNKKLIKEVVNQKLESDEFKKIFEESDKGYY
jgi:hypothetical protein